MLTPKPSSQPSPILISAAVKQSYYPSLNGLRGISIILVVVSHLRLSSNQLFNIILNGALGVDIFFVLSGFLITSLCLKEIEITGGLSLKDFYMRRILRIFPVAYLYVIVIVLLNYILNFHMPWFQFVGALLYIMNFSYFRRNQFVWEVGHYWSLSVEEQFYIIFPFILKKSRKVFTYAILFIIFVLPLFCLLQEYSATLNTGIFYAFTHYFIKFQSIAIGCLFAVMAFKKMLDREWITRYKLLGNAVAIFLIFYLRFDEFYTIKTVFTNLLLTILIGYVVVTNIIPARDVLFKLLNLNALSFIGVLSYSIYIWQQIFTSSQPHLPWFFRTFPYNVGFILVVPCLSYFLYEKYFLKLKTRFSRIKTKPDK